MSKPTSRRLFLKAAALVSAEALLHRRLARAQSETPSPASTAIRPTDTIVIGAGIAGLAAARLLQSRGQKVVVLEARNRVGGRVWTDRSLGVPLDLGATWIYGIDDNPVYDLAHELKVKTLESDYDEIALYDAQGKRVSEERRDQLEERFDKFLGDLTAASEDAEVEGVLQAAITKLIEEAAPEERRQLEHKVSCVLEDEYAADVGDLSLADWEQDEKFDGDDVLIPRGFSLLAEGMANGLDVKLEQRVRRIEHAGSEAKVMTTQGTFTAKQVIVTLPLGVLKNAGIEFEPALPRRKLTAISKLAMGTLNKVYLRFPAPFWPKDEDFIGFIGERRAEWCEFHNIYAVNEQPILCGINAGAYALQLEKMSDDATAAEAMKALRKMFGAHIPEPNAKLITRWSQDEFSRGAYSHIPPGASSDHYDAMAEPVGDRLFFAGEATSQEYPGTVHGALLSGESAAKRILAG